MPFLMISLIAPRLDSMTVVQNELEHGLQGAAYGLGKGFVGTFVKCSAG